MKALHHALNSEKHLLWKIAFTLCLLPGSWVLRSSILCFISFPYLFKLPAVGANAYADRSVIALVPLSF